MNKEKEQFCFWCGESLGVYAKHYGDLDDCGKKECSRETRAAYAEREEPNHEREWSA